MMMGYPDIIFHVLKEVVDGLGSTFVTKDVSESTRMKQAHLNLVGNPGYHADVGRALSEHRLALEIDEVQKHTKRGSRWIKTKLPSGHSADSITTKPIHSAIYKNSEEPS
jgi:hypothetical protein